MPKNIYIIWWGSCGWTTALYVKKNIFPNDNITLISSNDIGTIGVGESTLPQVVTFLNSCGIYEDEIINKCNATIKLWIEFSDWNTFGKFTFPYTHSLIQKEYGGLPFSYWYSNYFNKVPFDKLDISYYIFKKNKVMQDITWQNKIRYAYHLDAWLYGLLLKEKSEALGVKHIEGTISSLKVNEENIIESIDINNEILVPDLVFDCSGFHSIGSKYLKDDEYLSYASELPCDAAIVGRTFHPEQDIPPYTQAIAMKYWWLWRIPLQDKYGNGYVFAKKYLTIHDAKIEFFEKTWIPPEKSRIVNFRAWRQKDAWMGNCIRIGGSYGFIEPLESTGIHIFCKQLQVFENYFKATGLKSETKIEFNTFCSVFLDDIKDFIVYHYYSSNREDTNFWKSFKDLSNFSPWFQKKMNFIDREFPGSHFDEVFSHQDTLFDMESYTWIMQWQRIMPLNLIKWENDEIYLPQVKIDISTNLNHDKILLNGLIQHKEYLKKTIKKKVVI